MPPRRTAIQYRADVDGLRAFAVLVVIWFHSGLPGLPGGFTGVDIFFVISGYLITSIVHREAREGRFRFSYFYERRFRRIAPALLTVTAATLIAGYVLLLANEVDELAKSAVATVGMASNIYFWRAVSYFEPTNWTRPLLQTWSLGVEEQFYLLFPATLILAERFWKPRPAILALAIGSFILCLFASVRMPAASFYLLPTRGWELMIGGSLAVGMVSVPQRLREVGAITGIALMIAGCLMFSTGEEFPGWRALLPTIGAGLVIAGGGGTIIGRALSLAVPVYVGRISYSLYLWHWPIFVFLRHWRADLELPPLWAAGGIALTFALSVASYQWIEQPARRQTVPFRRIFLPWIAVAVVILGASAIAIAGRGFPNRFPARVNDLAAGRHAYAPLARTCFQDPRDRELRSCHIGPPGSPEMLLWGDSHAAAISEGVANGLSRPGFLIAIVTCAPELGPASSDLDRYCGPINTRTLQLAEGDHKIRTVVLSAYWNWHEKEVGNSFWPSVQRLVDRLNAEGKRVIVVAGIPEPGVDVPWASAIREGFGRPPLRLVCPRADVPLHGITLVDVSAGFCSEPASLMFTDTNHPSRYAGLKIVAPMIRRAIRTGK